MTTALTVQNQTPAVIDFDRERLELMKRTIAKGTTDDQFALFVEVCRRRGLDPFAAQIYAVIRKVREQVNGKWETVPQMTIQTGIDGYRLICQRAGNYAGMDGPYWSDKDGDWKDIWPSDDPPFAAKVGVRAVGDTDWTYHVAHYKEYVQTVAEYDGEGQNRKQTGKRPNSMWASMPANQLAKCAEAGARRKRWAAELAGIYIDAEAGTAPYVDAARVEQQIENEGRAPKAIKPPKRKSEKRAEAAQDAILSESPADLPQHTEEQAPSPPQGSDAAFGAFWNALPEWLESRGKNLGDVAMVLNVEPSAVALKRWFKAAKGDPMTMIEAALAKA